MKRKRNMNYKKIALVLSLCTLILWAVLGTGASLAWFSDTTPEIKNIFHFADFDLVVSHQLTDGKWEEIDSTVQVFDENALYEPGYTQVVYLKVENRGDVPFNFKTAVNVNGYVLATNVFGQQFALQDYLRFGLTTSDSISEMKESVKTRELAKEIATMKLNNYSTEEAMLLAGEEKYIALVVRMPEEIGNVANYRGNTVPKVELGIIVTAEQIRE